VLLGDAGLETKVETMARGRAGINGGCAMPGTPRSLARGFTRTSGVDPKRSDGSPVTSRSIDEADVRLAELPETGCSGHSFATRTRSRGRGWGQSRLSRQAHRPERCS
jgi:hypothetical protein